MSVLGRVAAIVMCATLATTSLTAQEKPPAPKPPAPKPADAPKATVFVIAKVGDKMEVLAKDAVDARKKLLADDYKKATAQYEKDKKAAESAKPPKKFDAPAPKATTLELTTGEFPTKEAAEAAMQKMEKEKMEKEKKDKEKKPGDEKKPGEGHKV